MSKTNSHRTKAITSITSSNRVLLKGLRPPPADRQDGARASRDHVGTRACEHAQAFDRGPQSQGGARRVVRGRFGRLPWRVGRNAIEKDPDLRVRAAIDLVFSKFDELHSVRQVHLWFNDEGLELPSRPTGENEQLRWQVPNYGRVHGILTNPVFAGAYAYGRTESQVEIRDGEKKITRKVVSDRDAWQVFIPDNHEGYISLETYERNRRVIADNSTKMMPSGRRGAVRSGAALLAGLVRCGHCGRKLTVTYSGTRGTVLRYICHSGMINHNEPKCISFSGAPADEAVGREIVRILEPIGLEAALRVIEDDANAGSEAVRQHEIALERARYEAHRAWQQYDAVDPGNRQVAGELERRWNERLIAVQTVETALEHAREACADMRMDEEEREACLQLGADLERAWNHEGVTAETRKRMLSRCARGNHGLV